MRFDPEKFHAQQLQYARTAAEQAKRAVTKPRVSAPPPQQRTLSSARCAG